MWALENFSAVFKLVQKLKDIILEYDPSMERILCVTWEKITSQYKMCLRMQRERKSAL